VKLKTREIIGSWSMKKKIGNNYAFPLWKFRYSLARKERICCLICLEEVSSKL